MTISNAEIDLKLAEIMRFQKYAIINGECRVARVIVNTRFDDQRPWSPTTNTADAMELFEYMAHLGGDFKKGDGFVHLTYGQGGDHGDDEMDPPCDPGHSEEDDHGIDVAPWSCHIHIGIMGEQPDGIYPEGWDHGEKFCARGRTKELAICNAALRAWGLK